MSVLVCGTDDALALAGAPDPAGPPRLVVALDDAVAPDGELPVLRWWRETPPHGAAAGERRLAPSGDGLWSCAPWPVREELFAMGPAAPGAVLVVERDERARGVLVAELEARGLQAAGAPGLTAGALARADVVIHGAAGPRPLAGDAFAVLAAGRVLVADATTTFGLVAGVHYLAAAGPLACNVAEGVAALPPAFDALRRFGRLAAAAHRAADVYARLLADA